MAVGQEVRDMLSALVSCVAMRHAAEKNAEEIAEIEVCKRGTPHLPATSTPPVYVVVSKSVLWEWKQHHLYILYTCTQSGSHLSAVICEPRFTALEWEPALIRLHAVLLYLRGNRWKCGTGLNTVKALFSLDLRIIDGLCTDMEPDSMVYPPTVPTVNTHV